MADISLVIDVIGEEKIEGAVRSTTNFEGRVKALDSALRRTSIGEKQFSQGLLEIKRAYKDAFGVSMQKASADIEKFKRSLDMSQEAAKTEQITAAYKRLAASLSPVERATQEYQRSLKVLNAARDAEIIDTIKYNQQLNILNGTLLEAQQRAGVVSSSMALGGNQIARYDNAAQKAAQTFKRRFNTGLQQAGFQVGDFFVQIASGQSALVAFGQQGSQLAGIFGPGGAVFGAILAIGTAIGVLVQNISGAKKEFDDAESVFGKFTSELENYTRLASTSINTTKGLRDEFGAFADEMANLVDFLRQVSLRRTLQTLESGPLTSITPILETIQEDTEKIFSIFENGVREVQNGTASFDQLRYGVESVLIPMENLAGEIGLLPAQALALKGMFDDLLTEETVEGVARQATKILEQLRTWEEAGADYNSNMDETIGILEQLIARIGLAKDEMDGLTDSARGFVSVFDGLGDGFLENRVRAGVESGAIPPWALEDLPLSEADKALEKILDKKRADARKEDDKKKSGGGKDDPLGKLWEQVKLERLLLGETEARQRVIQALGLDYQKYGEVAISSIVAEIEELKRLQDEMDRIQSISDSLEDGFSDFFNSLVDGTKTVEDAFKDMARSILAQLWDILVTQQIVGSWSPESGGSGIVGGIMSFLRNANGNAFMNGQVVPFANGGIVNGPTLFQMANGMGLMGEAGPEAVMPLKRGKDGKLGVAAEGGKGDTYVINQNFNFSANGDESVRRIIAQAAPEISKITQRDILETRRRGGTFKAAFG